MKKKFYRKPHRIKRKKPIYQNRFFWLSFFLFLFVFAFFYFIFFSRFFEIKKIRIYGNESINREEIENLLMEGAAMDFKLLKTKNLLLFNTKNLQKEILEKYPKIENIEMKKFLPDSLEVKIKERKAKLVFKKEDNLFLLDENGIIFEKTDSLDNFLIMTKLNLERDPNLGEKVIDGEALKRILYFISKVQEELKISLKEINIFSEERINVKTAENWEIYLNLQDDFSWQFIRLKTVLEKKIPKEKRDRLQYIDLRFERVYLFPETSN